MDGHLNGPANTDPMTALLHKYHLNAPSLRSFPRDRGDGRLMRAVELARPDAVIMFTEEWDDCIGFDYPTQRDLLRARGIETLFLHDQSYRHPNRDAQAETLAAFLAGTRISTSFDEAMLEKTPSTKAAS